MQHARVKKCRIYLSGSFAEILNQRVTRAAHMGRMVWCRPDTRLDSVSGHVSRRWHAAR